MANYVYIATSLDGFIADANGSIDWLNDIPNPEGSDFGFAEFMSGIDALVMGRGTYETVVTFGEWPYDKPVFVASSTIQSVPPELEGKAEIVRGSAEEIVADLRARGYENLYVDGGRTIQGFLAADLIDEMIITRIPVLLGGGHSLFGEFGRRLQFSHVSTELLMPEITKSRYVRVRE